MMIASPDIERALIDAVDRLNAGGLVAFPTETVYGLGADAENPAAVAGLYAAKGRPSGHPIIVHIAPDADLAYWAASVPAEARALIQAFWPGPLTLILPRAAHIPNTVSGGQDSIGLRCPSHPVAQALLRQFAQSRAGGNGGVAAPSANKFGQVSPTHAAHVRSEFPELGPDRLLILEGGPSQVGIESTIVDVSRIHKGVGPVLLRPGHITSRQLGDVLGQEPSRPDAAAPRASGTLKAHYAPRTPLHLVAGNELGHWLGQAGKAAVAVVGFSGLDSSSLNKVDWIPAAKDPEEYARELYALLRSLDEQSYTAIVLERPPSTPEWQAVNDRIGRAAAAFS